LQADQAGDLVLLVLLVVDARALARLARPQAAASRLGDDDLGRGRHPRTGSARRRRCSTWCSRWRISSSPISAATRWACRARIVTSANARAKAAASAEGRRAAAFLIRSGTAGL
jgi:hypothetical protein